MPNLPFPTSAISRLRKTFGGGSSGYTFQDSRPAHKPLPLDLSPPEFAIKSWFDRRGFMDAQADLEIYHANGRINVLADKFCRLSENLSLDLVAVFDFAPGNAEIAFAGAWADADFLVGVVDLPCGHAGKELASRGTVLERGDLLRKMIDPQPFERWLVRQGHTTSRSAVGGSLTRQRS